jgi:hypothetical protein
MSLVKTGGPDPRKQGSSSPQPWELDPLVGSPEAPSEPLRVLHDVMADDFPATPSFYHLPGGPLLERYLAIVVSDEASFARGLRADTELHEKHTP